MKQFKRLLAIFLAALCAIPASISLLFAEAAETDKRAYLIMALPSAIPISQLDNSVVIDMRSKEAFKAYPIKGASNMSYDEALKAVEQGKLDNRALLFVYTTPTKAAYGQDMEGTEGMETYMDQGERVGPIRRLIQFVMSLFGITPEEDTGLEDTPEYAGTTYIPPYIPPTIEDTSEEEVEDTTLPEENNWEEDITEDDTSLGENNYGLLPPLEEVTMPTEEDNTSLTENTEEDNTSLTEEDTADLENSEDESEEQDVVANPLIIGGDSGTDVDQTEDATMPIAGNADDTSLGIGAGTEEETIIPAEPVISEEDNAQQPMSVERLTKALQQRGYNLTIIPFD